jgi:hypothetical protein
MFGKLLPPTTGSVQQDRPGPTGWHLNGVPLNFRTLLLTFGLLMAIVLLAELGYRIVGVGPTDMTLPAAPIPVGPAGETRARSLPPSRGHTAGERGT